jgi:hypothetical protein
VRSRRHARLVKAQGQPVLGNQDWIGRLNWPVLERLNVGSVIKKRRKRMAKKKHRKLLKKTRIQRRRQGK